MVNAKIGIHNRVFVNNKSPEEVVDRIIMEYNLENEDVYKRQDMDGWNAESDAEIMLNGLGITTEYHDMYMRDLDGNQKVKVLLAQLSLIHIFCTPCCIWRCWIKVSF